MSSTSLWREAVVSKVNRVNYDFALWADIYSETLLLDGDVEDYEYLNKSRREVDGIDDREEWRALKVVILVHRIGRHH